MESKIEVRNLNLFYGKFHAVKDVTMSVKPMSITSIIGPSGCGKSTLLRCFNRMNDLIENVRISGQILFNGRDIYHPGVNLTRLRRRVGMVFQRPNPFPLSVFDNVAYGRRIHGLPKGAETEMVVEKSLCATGLWDEIKDKLDTSALVLSPEQQQRLCISRLLAVEPEVLLMDEPCSALDPIATQHIEELMRELAKNYTIVIVTHNMQQAARVSDYTAFFFLGELIEYDSTEKIFRNPVMKQTEDYITGRFG
ncbi:MAG: phosphate ABC transporter ATP-binding protein [Planctomycetes bacterium RBG_19FT_COMBO_48_8]|nr:MAG: phosphate ABC transporter ATP-binding protein [Planctomycetes bacterium RBG_19FT_COMBO_48_8]